MEVMTMKMVVKQLRLEKRNKLKIWWHSIPGLVLTVITVMQKASSQLINATVADMKNLQLIICSFLIRAENIAKGRNMILVLIIDVMFYAILVVAPHAQSMFLFHVIVEKNNKEFLAKLLLDQSLLVRILVANFWIVWLMSVRKLAMKDRVILVKLRLLKNVSVNKKTKQQRVEEKDRLAEKSVVKI
jgi:hypothetical protein